MLRFNREIFNSQLSPDGRWLSVVLVNSDHASGDVEIWDPRGRRRVHNLPTDGQVTTRFSPDSTLLTVGTRTRGTRVWSTETWKPVTRSLAADATGVLAAVVSPDGRTLATGLTNGTVRLWDIQTQQTIGAPLPGRAQLRGLTAVHARRHRAHRELRQRSRVPVGHASRAAPSPGLPGRRAAPHARRVGPVPSRPRLRPGLLSMSSDDRGRVVFLHSSVGDARMWAAQQQLLHERFETVALDLHELGTRPGEFSFVELVGERLPAILVGNSFGARVALETALAFGDRVPRLVLVDTAIGDHEWSEDMRNYLRLEEELLEAGDIDAAVELNLERSALPNVRDLLRPMQRRALELEAASEGELVWPDPRPLSALTMPVLVIVGERDTVDMNAIVQRIVREAPHARLEVIANASHHPSLEHPDAFNRLLLEFIA